MSVGVDVECWCYGCWCQVLMSSVGAIKRCTWGVVEGVERLQHLPLVSMLTLKDQRQLPIMFSLLIVNCKKQAARANISPRPAGWTGDVRDTGILEPNKISIPIAAHTSKFNSDVFHQQRLKQHIASAITGTLRCG